VQNANDYYCVLRNAINQNIIGMYHGLASPRNAARTIDIGVLDQPLRRPLDYLIEPLRRDRIAVGNIIEDRP
jgi:hypothetical protein